MGGLRRDEIGGSRDLGGFAGNQRAVRRSHDNIKAFSSASAPKPASKQEDSSSDCHEQFVDLRLDRKSSLFPEGLAGSGQGEVAYVDSINIGEKLDDPTNTFRARGPSSSSSLLVMRREAAEAIISAMDAFAAGKTWGETEAGEAGGGDATVGDGDSRTDGTLSHSAPETVSKGTPDEPSAGSKLGKDTTEGVDEGHEAEGKEEGATGAEGVRLTDEDGDGDGRGHGKGPKWEEAARLAERGRKPVPSTRRVCVQPQQRSFLLTGRRGTGKSCVLNQIVLHARSTGWIVVFVPDAWQLMNKGIYCCPSPSFKDMYDLPKQSVKMLSALKTAHEEQLKDVTLRDPRVLKRHQGAETVLDLVERGIAKEELAGTAHLDVLRELQATSEAKVLLAIDSYNELFQPSTWHYGDKKLESPNLTASHLLLPPLRATPTGLVHAKLQADSREGSHTPTVEESANWLPKAPVNGMVVCATTGRYPRVRKMRKKLWPTFEEVAGSMVDGVVVPVEPYTQKELESMVKHLVKEEILPGPLDGKQMAKLQAKSDGLPERVFVTCSSYLY